MDGGRRLLRSLKESFGAFDYARPAFAGAAAGGRSAELFGSYKPGSVSRPRASARRRAAETRVGALVRFARIRGVGTSLAVLLFAGVGLTGAIQGGQYQRFIAENGSPADLFARAIGLGIDAITISGARGLDEPEVLRAAGVSPKSSLLFLDVNEARNRLTALPIVAEASVRKLYPNRLIVDLVEREPAAIWQKDGALNLVSADGAPIAAMRDARYAGLPFVVGEGANNRLAEFLRIVEASGDLRGRIRAGILVGQRRWNLKLTTGLEVKLPEAEPEVAVAQLARLAREQKLLDKDLIYVDLRLPGRMYARLTEEAGAARQESLPKFKKRGPQ